MADPLKIGLIAGRDRSFPSALAEEVNGRGEGVVAEQVELGAPRAGDPVAYAVVVDRMSHEVPFYRSWLKHAALRGAAVINDPFAWPADDGFLGASLAAELGIAVPRTVLLPHKEYGPGTVHDQDLRNLAYPLDWQGVVDHVGLPCVLAEARGDGSDARVCGSLEELIHHYDAGGQRLMVVRERVEGQRFVRCLCVGEEVLAMDYDPRERRHEPEGEPLDPDLDGRIAEGSRRLARALGFDLGTIDWAVRGGVPYAVASMDPVPDLDAGSLPPRHFEWAVRRTADLATRLAREPRPRGRRPGRGGRLTGRSDQDGAGDLAEELPSLARGLPRSEV